MTTQPNHNKPLSACHHAPVKLVGGRGDFSDHEAGITMHYECTECGKAGDIANHSDDELDAILQDAFMGLWMRNEDGSFVALDDKYDILKGGLKAAIQAYVQQEVLKARLQERKEARNIMWLHWIEKPLQCALLSQMLDDRLKELENVALKAKGASHE